MFDPDPSRLVLRLGSTSARKANRPETLEQALASVTLAKFAMDQAQKAADTAQMAWIEAMDDYETLRARSQPIPAAGPEKAFHRLFDGFKPVNDGHLRYERPKVFRADGTVEHIDGFQSLDAPL